MDPVVERVLVGLLLNAAAHWVAIWWLRRANRREHERLSVRVLADLYTLFVKFNQLETLMSKSFDKLQADLDKIGTDVAAVKQEIIDLKAAVTTDMSQAEVDTVQGRLDSLVTDLDAMVPAPPVGDTSANG